MRAQHPPPAALPESGGHASLHLLALLLAFTESDDLPTLLAAAVTTCARSRSRCRLWSCWATCLRWVLTCLLVLTSAAHLPHRLLVYSSRCPAWTRTQPSQVVVGLVEGLPFADALLQRQITVGFASSGSSGGRAGESGVGGSSTLLAGGGATVEAGQQQLWQTVLVDAAQGSTVATLQSALQQVAANQAAVGNNISSGDASEDAVPVGAGSLSAPGAGASSPGAAPPGFQPPAETTEQQQQRQQQQQPHQQAGPSTGEATGEGFGTSVWSRAMQTLAGLRRTASGAARVAPVEEPAAAAAGEAHQEQGEDQHEAEQRQLSEPQLESLRSVAGPGRWCGKVGRVGRCRRRPLSPWLLAEVVRALSITLQEPRS